ncbi:MAG: TonB-dependent receptor [Bacteroidales bacterium]|nr:TonB-dependent receptor [Bacteroidales bacterium]
MNFVKSLLCSLAMGTVVTTAAQTKTIAGYVTDASSGETLIGAYIMTPDGKKGTETNQYGYFVLSLPEGENQIIASYVSYTEKTLSFNLKKDTTVRIKLEPDNQLEELVVTAKEIKRDKRLEETVISKEVISPELLNVLPAILGEPDLVKTVQTLPGVQSGMEGSSGLYVRGGSPDENLILLDDVPLYNVTHLFGFFSVFNADAIKNVNLHKGGFPARFGGRLSSVLDIHTKDGNDKELHGAFQIGLLSSKFSLEGPIVKERTTFFVSARRTYFDVLSKPFMEKDEQFGYYFWDLNAKVNHKFNDRHRLYFSIYSGRDKLGFESEEEYDDWNFGLGWGNISSALRWNFLIHNKLFMNTTVAFSKYKFFTEDNETMYNNMTKKKEYEMNMIYSSMIRDWSLKNTFTYTPNNRHEIKFGEAVTLHSFKPGEQGVYEKYSEENFYGEAGTDTTIHSSETAPTECNLFVEDEFKITKRINLNVGLHASLFNVNDKTYTSLEPRLAFAAHPTEKFTIKAAYTKMQQYLHLLSNSTIGLPTDLWVPVTQNIKPLESHQTALGFVFGLPKDLLFSIEGYYKTMDNVIEYKEGASLFSSTNWEEKVDMGKGRAKGIELMLKKETGKTTGWIAYTLSKAERKFDEINNGKWYPSNYDRTHDISIVINHKFSEKVDLGATWVFGTGYPVTMQTHYIMVDPSLQMKDYYDENRIDYAASRNNYRMENYHRLDLGVNFHRQKEGSKIKRQLSVSIFNVYNRHNPFFYYLETDHNEEGTRKLMKTSIFPTIPSVSYSIKF